MIEINPRLSLDEKELEFVFIRSTGPGGQNVNKVSTAVQLRFDIGLSLSLNAGQKQRLSSLAGRQVNDKGILTIEAHRFRTQEQNKKDAIQRLIRLIQRAAVRPKKRIPTHASRAEREKRLQAKQRHSEIKRTRKNIYE